MRFLLLGYGGQTGGAPDLAPAEGSSAAPPPADVPEAMTATSGWPGELGAHEVVYAAALADPAHAQTVELRGGVPVVMDGPTSRTSRVLESVVLVDLSGHDRAPEIAASLAAGFARVEVWPVDIGVGADDDLGPNAH